VFCDTAKSNGVVDPDGSISRTMLEMSSHRKCCTLSWSVCRSKAQADLSTIDNQTEREAHATITIYIDS